MITSKGYVIWLDKLGKWHSSEVYVPQLAVTHVIWLLNPNKRPWQIENEPESFAVECWIVPIPERHKALAIAKQDYKRKLLQIVV